MATKKKSLIESATEALWKLNRLDLESKLMEVLDELDEATSGQLIALANVLNDLDFDYEDIIADVRTALKAEVQRRQKMAEGVEDIKVD